MPECPGTGRDCWRHAGGISRVRGGRVAECRLAHGDVSGGVTGVAADQAVVGALEGMDFIRWGAQAEGSAVQVQALA